MPTAAHPYIRLSLSGAARVRSAERRRGKVAGVGQRCKALPLSAPTLNLLSVVTVLISLEFEVEV